jgi:hypothetical protein
MSSESFQYIENDQTVLVQYIFFVFGFFNMSDVLTFLPLFIDALRPYSAIFIMFRLGRLYSLINHKYRYFTDLLFRTFASSVEALLCIGVFSFFSVLIFGVIIYYIERGTFTVNADYPDGAYLIISSNDLYLQPSNFVSIPASMYWAVTTLTTGR